MEPDECRNGHLLDERNLYVRPNGTRECRACKREREGYGQPVANGEEFCRKGLHRMTEENTIIRKEGWRECRGCRRSRNGDKSPAEQELDAMYRKLMVNTSWMEDAKCKGMDPNFFHPGRGKTTQGQQAVAFCQDCPVIEPCREMAYADPSLKGVWGGTSERQRRKRRGLKN